MLAVCSFLISRNMEPSTSLRLPNHLPRRRSLIEASFGPVRAVPSVKHPCLYATHQVDRRPDDPGRRHRDGFFSSPLLSSKRKKKRWPLFLMGSACLLVLHSRASSPASRVARARVEGRERRPYATGGARKRRAQEGNEKARAREGEERSERASCSRSLVKSGVPSRVGSVVDSLFRFWLSKAEGD